MLNQQMLGYDVPQPTSAGGTPASTGGGGGLPAPGFMGGGSNNIGGIDRIGRGRGGRNARGVLGQYQPPTGPDITTTPGHHAGTLELASLQRGSDIADVLRYGGAFTAAQLAANPWLSGALTNLYGRLNDSPLLQSLNANALSALQNGGQLTPQEIVDLEQQSRGALAARGMQYGNQGIAGDILSRDAAVRQRMAAAQQFATGVEGLNRGQSQLALAAPGAFSSALGDPFQAILSRPSQTSLMPMNQMVNPTNPYFSDLYNTNYNAQAASNIAGANNQAALIGAGISAIGNIAGMAAMSDRRLKKDIRRVGKSPSGIPLYSFRYRTPRGRRTEDRGQKFIGPMAQDVEKRQPGAVFRLPGKKRYRAVDFTAIDAPFKLVKEAS